jgi:Uma2 family endonuclease
VERMATTRFTWQDVLIAPDDGNRYEAIDGDLYVTPPPKFEHQRISHRLAVALDRILVAPGLGIVVAAPVGVEFPDSEEGVQPDLLFVSNERAGIIRHGWLRGPPDLVIEILSPSTAARDRGKKLDLYRRQGAGEYWIVDRERRAVEVWRFAAGLSEPGVHTDRVPARHGDETVGEIALEEIFPTEG